MTPHSERAGRIEALVRAADPHAVWMAGSADPTDDASPACPSSYDTPLDVGALLPVLALWPVLGTLVGQGELTLHTPIGAYGADLAPGLPAGTTTHHLLTHADDPPALAALTRVAEHLGGGPSTTLAATRIWQPLGMSGTRFDGRTLYAPPADLARFLRHLLSTADHPVPRQWIDGSLRIRTGELTPARGLLWHPAPGGVWAHQAPTRSGPALWVSPRHGRWAALLPSATPTPTSASAGPLRHAFRDAVFHSTAPA
ncbi:hypothetical protein [Streptomyces sp. RerS4]|uniref:hypothetical protein n=1 Tax=Streptomyces sp. RerS4 TaxID=2942449 RepID=UPI00201C33ED|nr:hypothetical protein [Streptomyces sp. RerS4]UQX04327.1 hypothetical protein M4D82_30330 [Streptomyces sp. RerS4]